jgi:transcription elongation factor Elf1
MSVRAGNKNAAAAATNDSSSSNSASAAAASSAGSDNNNNNNNNNDAAATPSQTSASSSSTSHHTTDGDAIMNMVKQVAEATAQAMVAKQNNGMTSHKTIFDTNVINLKKQSSKQFLKLMYAVQYMHLLKCESSEILQVIDFYVDWIKRVEEDKGKVKEACEMLKAKLRKRFPAGKDKESKIDGDELWEIIEQKEILHCPFAEHWDMNSHDLDTCCFNKKHLDKTSATSSNSNSSSNMNNNYKRQRYENNSSSGMNYNPAMMNPMSYGMPNSMPSWPQQPAAATSLFQQQQMMQPSAYQQARTLTICGIPLPSGGVCQGTNHSPQNCFNNPNSKRYNPNFNNSNYNAANNNNAGMNQSQVSASMKSNSEIDMNMIGNAIESSNKNVRADTHKSFMRGNVSVLHDDMNMNSSDSERMPILRQLESSSSSVRSASNQLSSSLVDNMKTMQNQSSLASTQNCVQSFQSENESLHELYLNHEHVDSVLNHDSSSEDETLVDDSSPSVGLLSSTINHTHLVANKPILNFPSSLRFAKSLTRLMKSKFRGRKGKKIFSDERLWSLACERCNTRGHTIDMCINRQSDKCEFEIGSESDKWVRKLIDKPLFQLERLTSEKSWLEVEMIIEREGAIHNDGNPWMNSSLRRDMLRKNLGYWYVIGANATVLSWLGYGVQMRFLTEPDSYAFNNHGHSMQGFEQFVKDEHEMHVKDKSFIELNQNEIQYGSVRVLNPIMVAVNKKNKPRLCHDMRWTNGYLPHIDFRMETLQKELPDVVSEGDVLLSIDLAKAYYSVPLHPLTQAYLCWSYEGRVYKPTVMIFGVSPAPHVFTKIMRPWMHMCRSVLVKLMGMLDDYIFASVPHVSVQLARFVRYSLTRLGWQLNDKCQLTPQPKLCILGMMVDAARMMITAPESKLKDAHDILKRILSLCDKNRWVDVSLLQQFCGKLQSMSLALPGVRVFTRALYVLIAKSVDEQANPRFKFHPNQYTNSVNELAFWNERLCDDAYNGLPIHVRDAMLKMWVDASDIGWGGEVAGKEYHGTLPLEEIQNSSARRELVALLKVAESSVQVIENQRLHVYMDSHNAICNLIAGGGQKENLVAAVKQWFDFCEQHHIIATYEWIPREHNANADRYSKLPTIQYELTVGVEQHIRKWLSELGNEPTRCSHMAMFVPNFNCIALRLESIVMNMGEAILIIPRWSSQSWWPTLLKHRSHQLYLGSAKRVLKSTQQNSIDFSRQWQMDAHWVQGRRKITVQ